MKNHTGKIKYVDSNDYYWNEFGKCYINKKYKQYYYEYLGCSYSVNGELICVKKRWGNKYDYWGGIDEEGNEWEYIFTNKPVASSN